MPFLVENLKTDPHEWIARNQAAMKAVWVSDYLKIHCAAADARGGNPRGVPRRADRPRSPGAVSELPAAGRAEHDWNHRLLVRQLFNAVRTGDKSVFMTYCRDLAGAPLPRGLRRR